MNGNDNSIDVPGILRPDRGASMIVEVDAMDEVERGRRAKRTPWDLREWRWSGRGRWRSGGCWDWARAG